MIPEWWQQALLDAQATARDNIYFVAPPHSPYRRIKDKSLGHDWSVYGNVSLEKKDEIIRVSVDKHTVVLPQDILRGKFAISGLVADDNIYVAGYIGAGYSYPLVCIKKETGKVIWQTDVAAVGAFLISGSTAGRFHWVAVIPDGHRVLVCGATNDGIYIEGFETKDGTCLFRFGTTYSQ
jgi:hypothetical protein